MIKYRHNLRFIEGDIESGNFEEIATLSYEGLLPSAPSIGLIISLADFVEFEIAELKYLQSEEIYQSYSHIDFLSLESMFGDYVARAPWIAKYVKCGFNIISISTLFNDDIESAITDVVL